VAIEVRGDATNPGELVRRRRLLAGLTQQNLARKSGLSIRTLRDIERGRVARPHQPSLEKLASSLGMSDDERAELRRTFATPLVPTAPTLAIGILGPLVVRRGEATLDLSATRPRNLLGLLALQANQVVSLDEIIDVLWGDQPPRSCHSLLHVYIAQLRAAVEPQRLPRAPAGTVVRTRNGYRLVIDTDGHDLSRFQALAAAARDAAQAGDTASVLDRSGQALACWRGNVLADATTRLRHHPVALAATQARLATTLIHADAALRLGKPDLAVGPLQAIAHQEPFHEGLHARLILALAGQGHQAAALQLFTDIRTRLAEELAIEPGPEIREAHLRVLRGNPTEPEPARHHPLVPAHGEPRPLPVPAQLPLDVPVFTGRVDALAQLDHLAAASHGASGVLIAAISGTAGVGKTTLALHWAHRVANRFPDGQLYANLRGFDPNGTPVEPAEVLPAFLDAFAVPPERTPVGLAAQAALYRSVLAGKQVLVVLDNARDAEHVRPLLPGSAGCLVIVTSRNRLRGLVSAQGAHPVTLDVLTPVEARQLLADKVGHARTEAEPHAVTRILNRCAGLPLALSLAAAHAATHPHLSLSALAADLRNAGTGLDPFTNEDDPLTDVRALFSCSYRTLNAPAARLFRLLGLPPAATVTLAAAASLTALPTARTAELLAELTTAHLLTAHTPGRYTCHDLLHAYAREQALHEEPEGEQRAALQRLYDHHLHTAYHANLLLDPDRDDIDLTTPRPGVVTQQLADARHALAWFTAEYPTLLALIRCSAHTGQHRYTWQLAWCLSTFLGLKARWQERITIETLALAAARQAGDQPGLARTHRNLGYASVQLRRYDEADTHIQHALDLFRALDDRTNQALTHLGASWSLGMQGRYHEALDHAQHCLALYQVTNHQVGQARALNAIGSCHARLGDHHQALTKTRQALAILRQHHNPRAEADAWENLGYSHQHLGNHTEAIDSYQRALQVRQERDDRYGQAEILTQLGDTYNSTGNPHAAQTSWQQALAILDQLTHPDADAIRDKLATSTNQPPTRTSRRPKPGVT
jgi:DNA-binding SARP family transcriptional activator/tetratricopeptide (TPR) repeat protein/DNA-binding XRE family transcriptional regulator